MSRSSPREYGSTCNSSDRDVENAYLFAAHKRSVWGATRSHIVLAPGIANFDLYGNAKCSTVDKDGVVHKSKNAIVNFIIVLIELINEGVMDLVENLNTAFVQIQFLPNLHQPKI